MQPIVQELAVEHARELALLWSLHDAEPDADLLPRMRLHLAGLRACLRRGADPLAGLDRPLVGADLLPAACLGPVEPGADDDDGRRAAAFAAELA